MRLAVALGMMALACTGCAALTPFTTAPSAEAPAPGVPPGEEFARTNEPNVLGRQSFDRGQYGLAERYFREAVEKDSADLDSWIGLGASYDELKRFDLAERAYQRAFHLGGPSVALLNNMGYSYMMRGDARRARAAFERALAIEPGNETVRNNLRLLAGAAAPTPAPRP